MTGQQLAQLAWDPLEPKGDTDFARRLNLVGDYRAKRVRRWLDGENEPDYKGTMAMLSALGFLTTKADQAWRGELAAEVAALELSAGQLPKPASPARVRAGRSKGQR